MKAWNCAFTALLALGVVGASTEEASACGGTFCDSGPQAMPVDQSGENILFVMDGTTVEAHVQIQYQGDAERFAWVVPMQKIPEVSVGSQILFQNLLLSTVPTYGYQQQTDACGGVGGGGGFATGGTGGSSSGGAAGASSGGGPSVVYQETVGAFDVTVLQGGTAQEVADWLATNDYQTIPNAAAILQDYVDKQFVFTAIKLTGGAQTTEIHPLVFKYQGNEPCVPIKLTAVAATEDMGVRTFFLGDDRVVPLNYKHLTLNPVRIDWNQFASNYVTVVSRGADSPVSNGQGFVTEYAGASASVFQQGIYSSSWIAASFVGVDPELVIDTLNTMGITQCFSGFCQFNHPLIRPLLNQYIPVPAGLDEATFYADLPAYVDQIDPVKWDALAFSKDFDERIAKPGKHAIELLTKWPYLTRMFSTLSPAEMTLDPIFMPWPGLPPVQPSQQATRRTTCSGNSVMLLPDGREVALDSSSQWPPWDSKMPFVEEIEEYQADGDIVKLVDNTELIDAELLKWNDARGWNGAGGGNAGAGGNFTTGGTGNGGNGNPITNTASSGEAVGGCACGFRKESGSAAAILLGVGLVELLRRRRRAR